MPAYTATFSDGQSKHIANSKRDYSAAWQAKVTFPDGRVSTYMGFARDKEMAAGAIRREVAHLIKPSKWNRPEGCGELTHSEVVSAEAA
jgi:hypothetical protein